jgi:hypothetical protein
MEKSDTHKVFLRVAWAFAVPLLLLCAHDVDGQWLPSGQTTGPIYYNGGNVGVGTSNPQQKLEVFGRARLSAASTVGELFTGSSGGLTAFHIGSISAVLVALFTGSSAPQVVLLPTGFLGIGTSSPSQKLHVEGNIYSSADITAAGNISAVGSVSAKYQDIAEWVPSTSDLSAGTVVVLDLDRPNTVRRSDRAYDHAVAGVVTPQPGLVLGEGGDSKEMIATTGRVRVRVDATSASIGIGDLLVTSDKPGLAMRSVAVEINGRQFHEPGTILGKALEPLKDGEGEILVLLSLQ